MATNTNSWRTQNKQKCKRETETERAGDKLKEREIKKKRNEREREKDRANSMKNQVFYLIYLKGFDLFVIGPGAVIKLEEKLALVYYMHSYAHLSFG